MTPFEQVFYFTDYNVRVTHTSITYEFKDRQVRLASEFQNDFFPETGLIRIQNIYMSFLCSEPHQRKQMFDFIARGFSVDMSPAVTQDHNPPNPFLVPDGYTRFYDQMPDMDRPLKVISIHGIDRGKIIEGVIRTPRGLYNNVFRISGAYYAWQYMKEEKV